MAKYSNSSHTHRKFVGLLVLVASLAIGIIAVSRGNQFLRSNAATPVPVTPCSGNWNVTDCFVISNPTTNPVRFAYLVDCWDDNYCVDKTAIVTIQPGKTVVVGQPSGCSKWQFDLNWSNPDTAAARGNWQWGAVVEKNPNAVCSCNYTEVNVMPSL